MLLRSLLVWALWAWSGQWGWGLAAPGPWVLWVWRGVGGGLAGLAPAGGLDVGRGGVVAGAAAGAGGVSGGGAAPAALRGTRRRGALGLGCVVCQPDEPRVAVVRQADGSYQATLCGHFTLAVAGDHPFRMRLLVVFLSLLDVPGDTGQPADAGWADAVGATAADGRVV